MTVGNILSVFRTYNLSISTEQAQCFHIYLHRLLEVNQQMNLTAITNPEDVLRRHFLDCALLLRDVPKDAQHILDIGSGAGFPGMVLAILRPDWQITCMDGLDKRVVFLSALAVELNLINVRAIHARAEMLARDSAHRAQYDVVTSRAVSDLSRLLEWSVPFLRMGGSVLAMKGPHVRDEVASAQRAAEVLGASPARLRFFEVSGEARSVVRYDKILPTADRFPRQPKAIRSRPL